MKAHIYSVSQVNRYIKNLLERDVFLNDVFVEAEISNFKAHSSGHFYFTLKDENASISVVMYKSYAEKIKFLPENGMKVTVYGYVSLYEKTGQYQIYAQIIEPTGKGALYAAFEQLKNRLEKEGIFDADKKKKLPQFPKKIAVLTSPTGAAIRDVIRICKRRNPCVKIVIVPVIVQGDFAVESICKGLKLINEYKNVDLIILGRGGGSIEDLWCFNDEKVARAIFKSKIPIISAVGHETDFTISDFVADVRASTPSAAAEIAVPCLSDIKDRLYCLYDDMDNALQWKKSDYKRRFEYAVQSAFFNKPFEKINELKQKIYEVDKNIFKAVLNKKDNTNIRFNNLIMRLEGVSPMNVLKRGFSIVYKDNKPISSIDDVLENDIVKVNLKNGYFKSKITENQQLKRKY